MLIDIGSCLGCGKKRGFSGSEKKSQKEELNLIFLPAVTRYDDV